MPGSIQPHGYVFVFLEARTAHRLGQREYRESYSAFRPKRFSAAPLSILPFRCQLSPG